jgi:hypothetical protein
MAGFVKGNQGFGELATDEDHGFCCCIVQRRQDD